ncbi:MAG TPA: hypothetical protein VMT93_11170 [Gemmatimonadaceae bacterium]|nr:hypothetical protein [Gemmatimonadaceae bacterium]
MTRLRAACALAILAAAPLPAQAIRYAPGQFRYGVVTAIKRSDTRGGGKLEYTITATQAFTLLLTPRGADSLRFRLTLDAYTLGSDLPVQLPDVGQLQGTQVEGVVTAYGRMVHYSHHSPAAGGADAQALADNMSKFLVTLRPDAVDGSVSVDTTSSHQQDQNGDITERTVTTTRIDGDTLYAGEKAWRVRRTTEVTVSGFTIQDGKALQVSGGGGGAGTFYLSVKGVYLGAVTRSTTNTTITLPDGGAIVSDQEATSAITLVTK